MNEHKTLLNISSRHIYQWGLVKLYWNDWVQHLWCHEILIVCRSCLETLNSQRFFWIFTWPCLQCAIENHSPTMNGNTSRTLHFNSATSFNFPITARFNSMHCSVVRRHSNASVSSRGDAISSWLDTDGTEWILVPVQWKVSLGRYHLLTIVVGKDDVYE